MKLRLLSGAVLAVLFYLTTNAASGGDLGPLPGGDKAHLQAAAVLPLDIGALKPNWKKRIEAIKSSGELPIIDIESSFNSEKLNLREFAQTMDKSGVALIAYSHDAKDPNWSDAAAQVVAADPWRFIPATNGGVHPAWTKAPRHFLAMSMKHVVEDRYPLLGEFEFRHYPSPRQLKRGDTFRDVSIPVNGEEGHELFRFAEKTGIPFMIHYEIEDGLLQPLEQMLKAYPKAKVIWCHLAQIRYSSRSSAYGPDYVRRLIETYPNLYFDVAFGGPDSVYPGSGERHARVWDQWKGGVKREWVQVIAQHPWRFLAALDLGGDRQDELTQHVKNLRSFLDHLPEPAREVVAWKAAWKLLFGDE